MLGFGCSASALLWNGSPSGQRHPNKADLAALLIFLQDNNRAGSLVGLRGGHGALKPQRGRRGAGLLLSLSVAALGLLFVLGCADPVQTPPMHLQHACQVDCFFLLSWPPASRRAVTCCAAFQGFQGGPPQPQPQLRPILSSSRG